MLDLDKVKEWKRVSMLKNEGNKLLKAVLCTPKFEYFHVSDNEAHNITQVADRKRAVQQHDKLKSTLTESGCEVIDIPELEGHPNSVFTRDTTLCTPKGYVKLRMGLPTRRGEENWMAQILNSLGKTQIGSIEKPGTVEGGDIILAGSVAFVGHSRRTNENGVKQISSLLNSMGYEVRTTIVPPPYLHIGGAMSVIGSERVLCCRGVFPDDFFNGFGKIEVSNSTFISGNVISLDDKEVIADAKNSEAINALITEGVTVHSIDLSEFVKGTGGPSCLIMPVEWSK